MPRRPFGWHIGFAVAAAGMSVALGSYVLLAPRWLGAIGLLPDRRAPAAESVSAAATAAAKSAGKEARLRIGLLFVLASLLCAFSVGWFQLFGSWLLYIEKDINRAVGSFLIPVPWFTSINAAVVIVLAPMVAAFWGAPRHPQSARRYCPEVCVRACHGHDRPSAHVSVRTQCGAGCTGVGVDSADRVVAAWNG